MKLLKNPEQTIVLERLDEIHVSMEKLEKFKTMSGEEIFREMARINMNLLFLKKHLV